jgi:hypothetical protein
MKYHSVVSLFSSLWQCSHYVGRRKNAKFISNECYKYQLYLVGIVCFCQTISESTMIENRS